LGTDILFSGSPVLELISAYRKDLNGYFLDMSLADIEQIVLKLSETDRALLAAVLLESVAPDCLWSIAPMNSSAENARLSGGASAKSVTRSW
jgi:hypothetical protein